MQQIDKMLPKFAISTAKNYSQIYNLNFNFFDGPKYSATIILQFWQIKTIQKFKTRRKSRILQTKSDLSYFHS